MLGQLLEAALRSFALGGAVWLGLACLRVRSPQVRMTVWTVVLLASLLMPVLMHWATVPIPVSSPSPDAAIVRVSPATSAPAKVGPSEFPAEYGETGSSVAERAGPSQGAFRSSRLAAIDWPALAMGLYLVVGGVLLLRLPIGLALTWRLVRRGRRLTEDWAAGLDVRVSEAVATPVTFWATILLPAECLDWNPAKRRAVLAHEESHATCHDFHVLLLAALHRAVFWFSPFSWWLFNELAETAELVSDDAAIETLGDRHSYAEILLEVASDARPISSGIGMARAQTALKRIERILAATVQPPLRLGTGRRALLAMVLTPVIALTTVSFAKASKPSSAGSYAADRAQSPENLSRDAAAVTPTLWIGGGLHVDADRRVHVSAEQYRLLDAGDMFNRDAEWKTVANHTGAVQLPPGVILDATDEDLERAFRNLAERQIALALEFRVLVRTDRCSQWTKAYSNPGNLETILARIHRLGGDLKYVVMDDPFFFGHRFSGPGACRESAEALALQIAEKIRLVRAYFPRAEIGTADVVDESEAWIDELAEWMDVYQRVTGEPLAFFHADVAWSHLATRNLAPLATALKTRHIPFGIIYNADDTAGSDQAWIDNTRQHIAEIESTLGIRPYAAIFRSWAPYPSRLLPETQPGTLTNLAFQYLSGRPSVTLIRQSTILSGRVVDAHGHPIASAALTLDAVDVAGSMDMLERRLTGKVPANAATALVSIRANIGGSCVCAGKAEASVGTIRYHEDATGRHEEIPPFRPNAGNAPVRVLHLVPEETTSFNLRRFPVTPGADYHLDVPLSVSANGERAGFVALTFLDGSGKTARLDRVWFRPSVRSLGHAVTNADGRFRVEIPPGMVEAGSDIRAYFPGSASLGSQTVTASTR